MLVYLFQYKIIKEGLSFVPDIILPLRLVGCWFFFVFSVFSTRSLQFLRISWNPGNAASSQCCCALVQDLLVWGARLSSQESRRLATLLHSDSLPEYTQIREEATGERRKGARGTQRGPKVVQLIPTVIQLWLIRLNLK